mmetsp:Transcript_38417/g.102139  ORF Transcript_38417/g.102139 Transcript_38417/m.102139 type:complete len:313 (+) Transcript_38417:447-1385(+)
MQSEAVHSCSKSKLTLRAFSIVDRCKPPSEAFFSHCGSEWCRSAPRSAASIVADNKLELAFARRSRERTSDKATDPDAPRALVAAMHAMLHRQCAGEARRGRASTSVSRLFRKCFAFALWLEMASSSSFFSPPIPLYVTTTCLASMSVTQALGAPLPLFESREIRRVDEWTPEAENRRWCFFCGLVALTSCTAGRLMRCRVVQRRAYASRSTLTKHVARAKTPSIYTSANSPEHAAAIASGMPCGATAWVTAAAVRNEKMAAAVRGVTSGLSMRSIRTRRRVAPRSLRLTTLRMMSAGDIECDFATSRIFGT